MNKAIYTHPINLKRSESLSKAKNVLLVIDGSYGVARQIISLSKLDSGLGIDLTESYIDNDYQDKDERLVDMVNQPYPILDEGLGEEQISDGIITMIEALSILAEYYKQHPDETKVARERFIELLTQRE